MNFVTLKQHVAAMLQREPAELIYDSVDVLANAINNAQDRAQRLVDFKHAMKRGYLPLTNGTASWLNDMLDGVAGNPVLVKKFKSFYRDEDYLYELKTLREPDKARLGSEGGEYIYLMGTNVYARGLSESIDGLYTIYYEKLADLSADTDTNFLTDFASDWIIFQAYFELQFFLKEDERAMQSAGILSDKWNSVVVWNDSMYDETDVSLD